MKQIKNAIFVAAFNDLNGSSNNRTRSVIEAFKECTENIRLITTDFNHGMKTPKTEMPEELDGVKVEYLHVQKYKKNLSIIRIWSHIKFAMALKKRLKELMEHFEIIYCTMPTSTSAYVCGKYCKRSGTKLVVDVIDLWPNSLIPIMPMRNLLKIVLSPWQWITNRSYKMADYISSESKKYAEVAHEKNPKVPWSSTYIGVDKEDIDKLIAKSKVQLQKEANTIYLCYAGNLGNSYDFDSILKAVKYIHEMGVKYKMLFVGEGEKRSLIENYTIEHKLNVEITGFLPYEDLLKYLSECDIAFNAFTENTLVVHSYKFNDYLATSLFIMNNLKGETAEMINKYGVGRNFNSTNLNEKLYEVCLDWKDINPNYKNMISKLINDEFAKPDIYNRLRDEILNVIEN